MTKRIRKLKQCEKPMQKNTRDGRLAVEKDMVENGGLFRNSRSNFIQLKKILSQKI